MQHTSTIPSQAATVRTGLCSLILAIAGGLPAVQAIAAEDVKLVPRESWTNLFAGRDAEFHYRIDAGKAFQGRLGWSLSADERTLQRGETAVALGEGGSADVPIKLRVPEVRESVVLAAALTVRVYTPQGAQAAEHKRPLGLFSENPFAGRTEWLRRRKLTLFDPSGETARCLKWAGVPMDHQKRLTAVENLREGVLLIGEGVSFARHRGLDRAMVDAARRGVSVICLAPSEGKASMPGIDSDESPPGEIILRREGAITRLDKRLDARGWPLDGQTRASGLVIRSEKGQVVAAIETGQKGWAWLEADYPKPGARLILCTFAVVAHWDATPAARYLLMRLLEYGDKQHEPMERATDEKEHHDE